MHLLLVGIAFGVPLLARPACPCSQCLAVPAALLQHKAEGLTCVGASADCDSSCAQCAAGESRGEPTCSDPQSLALLQEAAHARCPPPQPCTCNCECPEVVNPVPVAGPLLPTPTPMQLTQTGTSLLQTEADRTVYTKHQGHNDRAAADAAARAALGQPLPGTAPAMPGAPINLMPPPPIPPLPPLPPDLRIQDCPHNTPCTCYCHCRRPPEANNVPMFTLPTMAPCNMVPTTTTTTTSTTTTSEAASAVVVTTTPTPMVTTTTEEPPCQPVPLESLGPWAPGKQWGPKIVDMPTSPHTPVGVDYRGPAAA